MSTNSAASNIFQINNGDLQTLPERPMRKGFYGETLESALQRLLSEHPEVIPGDQLVSDGEEAPRFLLLKREAPVGSWSLDHLFIDQFGVPTLVECKLIENSESRREVIGQIIEYAANARAVWSDGLLRELANSHWSSTPNEIDRLLATELGVEDIEAFWQSVNENISAGRIRLIIAGDHIHTNVQRMIEYLNSEMTNTDIYGLEVNCYGQDSDNVVMMTRVVGRVQASADKRVARKNKAKSRTIEEIRSYFSSMENEAASSVSLSLLDWAVESARYAQTKSVNPAFKVVTARGDVRACAYGSEGVWVWYKDLNEENRREFHEKLVEKGLTSKLYSDKTSLVLEGLTPSNFDHLTELLAAD